MISPQAAALKWGCGGSYSNYSIGSIRIVKLKSILHNLNPTLSLMSAKPFFLKNQFFHYHQAIFTINIAQVEGIS